ATDVEDGWRAVCHPVEYQSRLCSYYRVLRQRTNAGGVHPPNRFITAIYFTESDCAANSPGMPTEGVSISSLRITRFVAFRLASSKPCPCVMASVGHASTQ